MEEIDKNKATLTKSEKALYESWTDGYRELMATVGNLINELHTYRLQELGKEKGLNMEEEEWTFDHTKEEFVKKEKRTEPELKIPSKETQKDN